MGSNDDNKKLSFSIDSILTNHDEKSSSTVQPDDVDNQPRSQNSTELSGDHFKCTPQLLDFTSKFLRFLISNNHQFNGSENFLMMRYPRFPITYPALRTQFTSYQLHVLESKFLEKPRINFIERIRLAQSLNLTERQVIVWFQNRRAREKRRMKC